MSILFSKYREACMRTAGDITPEVVQLGLCGEAGEVADIVKKHLGHGHPLDRDKLIEELGDLLWYCAVNQAEATWSDGFFLEDFDTGRGSDLGHMALTVCRRAAEESLFIFASVAALARCVDSTIDEVAERNIAKLKKRYPDGFSRERSINRGES